MKAPLALVLLLVVAGCVSPGGQDAATQGEDSASAPITFAEDYDLGNKTLPAGELTNATLGAEHVHDAWGQAEELVLFDDTLAAGDCEGTQDALFYALVTAFDGQGPAYGCARVSLPEGVVVPEGAGALRIEVDATDALKSGGMQFQFRNKAREENAGSTTEKSHVWKVELTKDDWDIAHANATTFVMYLAAAGPGSAFAGEVTVRIVAEKQEAWAPIVAIAHVDHWKLPSLHDFAAPGVMRLLDADASVANIDPARVTGGAEVPTVSLVDIIAPRARFVVVVADTTSSDCAPVMVCFLVPVLHVGGYERERFGTPIFEEGARHVYRWSVPDEVPEDSVYANISSTFIAPRIDACAAGDAGGPSCGTMSIGSSSVKARVQVFAFEGDVDLDLLKAIAG